MTMQIRETGGWTAMLLSQLGWLRQLWQGRPHDSEVRAGVETQHPQGVYGVLSESYINRNDSGPESR
jgi:hypothetical protein